MRILSLISAILFGLSASVNLFLSVVYLILHIAVGHAFHWEFVGGWIFSLILCILAIAIHARYEVKSRMEVVKKPDWQDRIRAMDKLRKNGK